MTAIIDLSDKNFKKFYYSFRFPNEHNQ